MLKSGEDAHVPLMSHQSLNDILCWEYTRVVANDWVVRFDNQLLQIVEGSHGVRPKQRITVKRNLDGKITLWANGQKVCYQCIAERLIKEIKLSKNTKNRSQIGRESSFASLWRKFNPKWLSKAESEKSVTA